MSVYRGEVVSDRSIVEYSLKVRYAFPSLPPEFYGVLLEMVREENFTDERFRDAVHHVIKTCIYPTPTIANFINFDKKIKLNSYEDMLKKVTDYGAEIWKSYKAVKFPEREKPVWVHVDDMKLAKLTEYKP